MWLLTYRRLAWVVRQRSIQPVRSGNRLLGGDVVQRRLILLGPHVDE